MPAFLEREPVGIPRCLKRNRVPFFRFLTFAVQLPERATPLVCETLAIANIL